MKKEEIAFNKKPYYEIYDMNEKKVAVMSNDTELTFTDANMEKIYKSGIKEAIQKSQQYIEEEKKK